MNAIALSVLKKSGQAAQLICKIAKIIILKRKLGMRKILTSEELTPGAESAIVNFHPTAVDEAINAIKNNEWVIIGMAQNPLVKKAKRILNSRNIKYKYIEHGSYFSQWKIRLAIKLWSGWPTFPQVFHKGKLIGGASDLNKYLI